MIKIGIDIGSTTVKVAAIGEAGDVIFSRYERHNADARGVIVRLLGELQEVCGQADACVRLTGSVGMGFAEACSLPFVQEMVAATKAVQKYHPEAASLIDIGGEDAKVVFFRDGRAADLRMNGNCAGGTGAFIDQMAVLLDVGIDELGSLALQAGRIYPIASRCGVFCKTDIQNLVAKNVNKADIAASILHAVAVQTVVTLAHGCEITPPVVMCGGPLTFIPALRKAFKDYLSLADGDIILPEKGEMLPALGAAMSEVDGEQPRNLADFIAILSSNSLINGGQGLALKPIFTGEEEHSAWLKRMSRHKVGTSKLREGAQDVFIGIDSGSTTTKIVVTDTSSRLLYSYYTPNKGNPIEAVEEGLKKLQEECVRTGATLYVKGSCSTGYGEDLVKAAFQLDGGIVETIAHYMAAHSLDPDVSFILDIGGQDMKAMFITGGVIDRIEIKRSLLVGLRLVHRDFCQDPWLYGRRVRLAGVPFGRPVRPRHTLHGVHELQSEAGFTRRGDGKRHRRRTGLLRSEELPVQGVEAKGRVPARQPHRSAGRNDAQRRRGEGLGDADRRRSGALRHARADGSVRLRPLRKALQPQRSDA